MPKLSLNGVEIEAPAGAPLVEVIKQNGVWISNLCYVDGLQPYAGCRTCLVEIEGARGLQLACTSRVAEGMVVRTDTGVVKDARQAVLSIINANHSDRCLTCHRRVHCMPGDICLRDDNVTHRCLTCAKNYRCELQTTNELLEMSNYEPWAGEERTYYESEQPEADRANPFLEFDPQMCIICTRCVRACDEIRHTGAVTLAGRGFTTQIAFGAGGAIHESNCDFCGSCIDVCPTATLLEKPNKWIAKTETWISTTCNSCSVGCTLSMGIRNGKIVMVKPDLLNPVSADQICVRGRFHYDAVPTRERLTRHRIRSGGPGSPALNTPFDAAIEQAAARLAGVIQASGPASVGFLVAPWATNEEAFLAQKLARGIIGTENIDSTAGPVSAAAESSIAAAFGTSRLPADMTNIATASTVVVIADDLESSHNIAALRVKDAVVRAGATLVVVSTRYGEVADFILPPPSGTIMPTPQRVRTHDQTGVWLRPNAGDEAATVAALCRLLAHGGEGSGVEGIANASAGPEMVDGIAETDLLHAAAILKRAAEGDGHLAVVFAPNPASPAAAAEVAKAAANLAILCRGEGAADSLYYLPVEANVNGIRDMGALPVAGGLDADHMLENVKALVVVGDNPVMHLRDSDAARERLAALDCLITIDSLYTDTAKASHFAFADLPTYGKDGTYLNADNRVLRLGRGETATGDQRDCLEIIAALGNALASRLGLSTVLAGEAEAVMEEIATDRPAYAEARYATLESGRTRALATAPSWRRIQPVAIASRVSAAAEATGDLRRGYEGLAGAAHDDIATATQTTAAASLLLTTARTLYTSLEGASIHSEEADKLHREEFIEINPLDAARLGIGQNRPVTVQNGGRAFTFSAALTDAVAPGSVFLPLYYDGGAVNALLHRDGETRVTVQPA